MPQSPISILGKRSNEEVELDRNEPRSPMEVDTVTASNTQQGNVFTQFVTIPENDVEMENGNANTSVVQPQAIPNAGPPPLPPRRRTEGVGEMMFGVLSYSACRFCLVADREFHRQTERCCRVHGQLHVPDRVCAAV